MSFFPPPSALGMGGRGPCWLVEGGSARGSPSKTIVIPRPTPSVLEGRGPHPRQNTMNPPNRGELGSHGN